MKWSDSKYGFAIEEDCELRHTTAALSAAVSWVSNYQVSNLVLGVEWDFDWTSLSKPATVSLFLPLERSRPLPTPIG